MIALPPNFTPRTRDALVERLLRLLQPVLDQVQRRLGPSPHRVLEILGCLLLGKGQHVIGDVHASRRTPDAHAHAIPIARADLIADGAQAVVTRMPAAELHANGAGVDVQLVMDDTRCAASTP